MKEMEEAREAEKSKWQAFNAKVWNRIRDGEVISLLSLLFLSCKFLSLLLLCGKETTES